MHFLRVQALWNKVTEQIFQVDLICPPPKENETEQKAHAYF